MAYTIHEGDVPPKVLKGRVVRELLTVGDGCYNLSLGVGEYDARSRTPGHMHSQAEEVIYVLQGCGEVIVGDEAQPIRPGTAIHVPPRVVHSIRNLGDEPIKLVFAFSPPVESGVGPEIDYPE